MATKNLKSAGNTIAGQSKEYWINAAKQFVWPIDFDGLVITVPQRDLELAENNLMVSHFRARGWHIQSVIGDVAETKVYNAPVTNGKPMFKDSVNKEQPAATDPIYKIGDKFKIKSTDCELKITHISAGKIHLSYTNRQKHDLISGEENLNKVLRTQVWERL